MLSNAIRMKESLNAEMWSLYYYSISSNYNI